MESASKPAANVRAASVARLKRAASLPRMKDGRRPAVHGSDGELQDTTTSASQSASVATTPFTTAGDLPSTVDDRPKPDSQKPSPEKEDSVLVDDTGPASPSIEHPEPETHGEIDQAIAPALTRGRRRRSRSRGSRSGTPKLEIPPSSTTSVITPIQRVASPATALLDSIVSESQKKQEPPQHLDLSGMLAPEPVTPSDTSITPTAPRNRTFVSPIGTFQQLSPLFANGTSPFVPIGASSPLPLAELQSNYTAGGLSRSVSVGRAHALHKLLGGNMSPADTDLFPPFGPSRFDAASPTSSGISETRNAMNTPPPATLVSRSNTVAGGERSVARAAMLQKIRGRVGPVTPRTAAATLDPPSAMPVQMSSPEPHDTSATVGGLSFDETVVNTGIDEVLVMPEIVARENKRRRRRSKRTSSSAANHLATIEDGSTHDHDTQSQGDFMSDGTSASVGTSPASHFSPLPSTIPLSSASILNPHSSVLRATPSPAYTPPPIMPLDTYISLINGSTPSASRTPDVPEGPRRIEELNEAEIRRQEEMQARYFQGLNLLRAASGETPATPGPIRVLIEEEDEPLPVPVLEPTSPSQTDVPETVSSPGAPTRPSVDSVEIAGSIQRQHHDSMSPSLLSSTDGQSSPGLGGLNGMARVPIVMHQYGQDGQPTGFGRKGRVKAPGLDDAEETDVPLVNFEPFPTSIVLTPGKDQPHHYSGYHSDVEQEDAGRLSANQPMQGGRLGPTPRSWDRKSAASWIDSYYFQTDEEGGENEDQALKQPREDNMRLESAEMVESSATGPSKEEWDVVLPRPFPNRSSPGPTKAEAAGSSSPAPALPVQKEAVVTSVAITTTEEDRLSGASGSDAIEKGSSSSGRPFGRKDRPIGRQASESQDSSRLGYTNSQTIDHDEEPSLERKPSTDKVSGWAKVKQTIIGRRRSRSNSFVRDRVEKVESGINRESGNSFKDQPSLTINAGPSGSPAVSPSQSGFLSTGSINIPRGVSPLPPPSPGDFAKYNDSKLMPFPGIYQLEEQRNHRKAVEAGLSPADAPGQSVTMPLFPNAAALSAPLPPSVRDSPDEGSEQNGRGLQRNPSLGNMRQQDRNWPHDEDQGGSISRSASSGSNIRKWLKVLQPGPASNSPSPAPYPYPLSYSPAPSSVAGERPTANLNRRPSAAEIFLPHGGLQRRPSTPNILQGLSRKSSLADAHNGGSNAHGLKTATSKSSLKKAFGMFAHESHNKEAPNDQEEPSTRRPHGVPSTVLDPKVNEAPSHDTITEATPTELTPTATTSKPAPVVEPEPVPSEPTPAPTAELARPPSPSPLVFPPSSTVPIPPATSTPHTEVPPRTMATPPPAISRLRSPPPPLSSRPQSPLSRAQSPSILKKESAYRAQSPPIRAQSPGFDLSGVLSPLMSPRSHSPFHSHSPSLGRSKGLYVQKALSSADIISGIDNLLNRNSTSSSDVKSKVLEDPPRKLLLVTPVLQVASKDVVKDRTLFLFSDLLIVAKCMTAGEGGLPMDKSYIVKNVLDLKRCSGPSLSMGSCGLSGDRRSPALQAFVEEFNRDQAKAVARLCDMAGVKMDESQFIAGVLFKAHEIERPRLGDFLARKNNREILHAFVDRFNFAGTRIDHALRIFLLSLLLSDNAEPRSLENLLAGFATRWFYANGATVAFDKECAKNLVISIVLLNASLHMSHAHQHAPASYHEFAEAVRAYDQRYSIKEDLLEDIYEAVKQEKISAPKENPNDARLHVEIKGATNPMHFTYRFKSDFVRVRIPAPDPNFRIHLLGHGLIFEPPTLHFTNSAEATFRVTGTSLGTKSILYWRAGANAHLYSAMPLASDIVIERAFMRNTLRIDIKDAPPVRERDSMASDELPVLSKKTYVFSIEDPREYDHWAKVLKTRINRAAGILEPDRPPTAQGIYLTPSVTGSVPPRIRRATEMVAFEVLKETLMGSHTNGTRNTFGNGLGHIMSREISERNHSAENSTLSNERTAASGGSLREGREIETLCVQNSLIPALISLLMVQRDSVVDNLHVGNGIGRPQTPKAINIIR